MSIDVELMQTVNQVFQETFQQCLASYQGQSAYEKITEFVARIILTEKPYVLVTGDGLTHLISQVFRDPEITDFVLTLTFSFYARMGTGGASDFHVWLAKSLADSVCYGSTDSSLCAIPKDIALRLGDRTSVMQLLQENRWVVVIMLTQLFVTAGGDKKEA